MDRKLTLGDLVDVDVGFPFASRAFSDDVAGIRLLRGDNVGHGRVRWDGAKRWPGAALDHLLLRVGDVVVAMDRPWIGSGLKWATVRAQDVPSLLVQRVARLRARDPLLQEYLRCIIASRQFTEHVLGQQTGTTVPHISSSQIASFPIGQLPCLTVQRAIGDLLGALDDKIESNERMSRVLRELAESHWASFQSDVAEWSSTTFGAYARVFGGSTPRTAEAAYWGGPHRWVTPSDVTGLGCPYLFSTARTVTAAGLRSCSAELHPPGTIFITSRASIGHFVVGQVECAANQGFIVVRPEKARDRWFLFHELRSRIDDLLDRANGSTFLEISRGSFKDMRLRVPTDPSTLDRLHVELDPLHERAAAAARESMKLVELCDALLPELLSGRLCVPEAEELVESVT